MKQLLLIVAFLVGIVNVNFAQRTNYWSAGLGLSYFPSRNLIYIDTDFSYGVPVYFSYTFKKLSLIGTLSINHFHYSYKNEIPYHINQIKKSINNDFSSSFLIGLSYKFGNKKWQPFLEAGLGLSRPLIFFNRYEYFNGTKERNSAFLPKYFGLTPLMYLNTGVQWSMSEKYTMQFQLKILNNFRSYKIYKLPFDYGFGINLLRHF